MFLIIACAFLLGVIGFQNWVYPQLRSLTISDGLYQEVPTYWLLDASYVVLGLALAWAAAPISVLSFSLATIAAILLLTTAASNTLSTWVDKVTNGQHNVIHTDATVFMFIAMLAFQAVNDSGWLWVLSGAGIVVPALTYLESKRLNWPAGPNAEKAAVFLLCVWLAVWSQT